MQIDINVDTGEGFNIEAKIMPFISSCNIACGGHAGNFKLMEEVILLAKEHKVRIGAHPSFEDRENFGRYVVKMEMADLFEMVMKQVSLLSDIAERNGTQVDYIKPHGALYHLACHSYKHAEMFVQIIHYNFDHMKMMGMPNSILEEVAKEWKVGYIREGFADRKYEGRVALRNRDLPGANLETVEEIKEQVKNLSIHQKITSFYNEEFDNDVDSICFHGDHKNSADIIEEVVTFIRELDVKIEV